MARKRKKRIILISIAVTLLVGLVASYFGGSWYLQHRALGWKSDGIAASIAGDDAKASGLLLRYLRRHPSDTEALTYYVTSRERSPMPDGQQFAETIAALKLLIQQRPERIEDRLHLLELYAKLERGPEAVDTADAILIKAPKNARVLQLKTELLISMGRDREALETANRWSAVAPDQLPPHLARLSLEGHLERPPAEILADATRLRLAHPGNADFEVLQGFAFAHAGDDNQARDWLKTAAAHPDLSPETAKILVDQLDAAGMSADALIVLDDLVKRSGNDDLRRSLAQRLWELQRWTDTVQALQPLNPSDAKADPTLLAFKCISLADIKDANSASLCRKALADSTDPVARAWTMLLGRILDGAEVDDQKIVAACQTAISIDPGNSYLTYYLGEADLRRGELDLAIDAFRRAVGLNSSWNLPAMHLVDCLLQKGKPEQAVQVAESCAQRHPNDAASVIMLARAWASGVESGGIGQSDGLLKLVDAVQKEIPGEDRTLLIQIQLLCQQKKIGEATSIAQRAITRVPSPSQEVFRIITLLSQKYEMGLQAQCYHAWENALGITPALAYAKAVDQFTAGHADGGLSLLDDLSRQSGKSSEMGWQLTRAEYLDLIGDPGSMAAWTALRDRYFDQIVVQEAAVRVRAGQGDWKFMQPVIDNLHKLSGDDGLAWRLASAALMIESPRSEADIEKGSVELNKLIQRYPNLVEPHVLLARALVHMKRNDGAIEQFTVASKLDPTSVPIALQLAALLQSQGDFERVEQELDRITPAMHTKEQRQQAAILLSRQNDPSHAIALLQHASSNGSTTAPVSSDDEVSAGNKDDLLLAMLYRQQRETSKADGLARKLMEHPDFATIQFASSLFLSEGLNGDAEATLRRLDDIELKPGIKDLAWGWYYSRTNQMKNAVASYIRATTAAPTYAPGWRELVIAQLSDQQIPAAMQTLDQACITIPGDADLSAIKAQSKLLTEASNDPRLAPIVIQLMRSSNGHASLIELLQASIDERHSRDMEHYAATLQNLCERHPESLACHVELVKCYMDLHRADQAVNAAMRLMTAFPTDAEPTRLTVQVCRNFQRWPEMASAAQKWKDREPEAVEVADCCIAQADIAQQHYAAAAERLQPYITGSGTEMDRHADALVMYTTASAASGNSSASEKLWSLAATSKAWRHRLLSAALQLPDGVMAAQWLERASQSTPQQAIGERIDLAQAYYQLGLRLKDQALLSRASKIRNQVANDPGADAMTVVLAAEQAEGTGQLDDAERFYRRAIQLDASMWVAQNNLAMILLRRNGDLTEASLFAQSAVNLSPQNPALLDTLASIRAKAGDMRAAAECMRVAVRLSPDDWIWQIRLGEYLLDQGDRAGASQVIAEIDANLADLHRQRVEVPKELEVLRRHLVGKSGKT